jgi:hypothetical protein
MLVGLIVDTEGARPRVVGVAPVETCPDPNDSNEPDVLKEATAAQSMNCMPSPMVIECDGSIAVHVAGLLFGMNLDEFATDRPFELALRHSGELPRPDWMGGGDAD